MKLRNIAIIAHVDHGKTTLIDKLLSQSGAFRDNQKVAERIMDSNDLEKERGITILAKCTSVVWDGIRINIIDPPGHADFGGEVERILSMVDSAILLVDAAEGPMPQTKFVLSKALQIGLRPLVIINKIDKSDSRPDEVVNEIFDLFAVLNADEYQLDFPILYGSGRSGWVTHDLDVPNNNLNPLFELIIKHTPPPQVETGNFKMLGTILGNDPYLGRLITGKVFSGEVVTNQQIKVIDQDGNVIENGRVTKILAFRGTERAAVESGTAGDIISIAGLTKGTVADTLCSPENSDTLNAQPIDPPTVQMAFSVNDSPLAGSEGDKVTGRMIGDRLIKEGEGNITLNIEKSTNDSSFLVSGRGELQLSVLIETMRREGYELSVSKPQVLMKNDEQGNLLEPIEEVIIDVDDEYAGQVVQDLNIRKGVMLEMKPFGIGRSRLIFEAPTRGLIGYQSELLTVTSGTAVINRLFSRYESYKGEIKGRTNGVLISNGNGISVAFALFNLEERGQMIIGSGIPVYQGMIIGVHTRPNDLEVNILKGKKLTNIRTHSKDEAVKLTPPLAMNLEKAIAWISDDELIEVTPKSIRIRKKFLDPNVRKKITRKVS
ncbi:MAG: translational GTPase TypA [Flavobacteriaceae bacterium]|nr:translational GTPase TypA [Flavobacteriaceae bacterium]